MTSTMATMTTMTIIISSYLDYHHIIIPDYQDYQDCVPACMSAECQKSDQTPTYLNLAPTMPDSRVLEPTPAAAAALATNTDRRI